MAKISTKIFRQEAKFIAGVAYTSQFPKLTLPQIAFCGKSNVGKSSLINSICRRKNLARVSHTPGRTCQINFFSIAEKLLIADLPGYGFAKVSKTQRTEWKKLINYYFHRSEHLKLVNLLIDARRGIKENDIQMMEMLKSCDKKFQIILTKTDKINLNNEFIMEIQNHLVNIDSVCNIIYTSSRNNNGVKEMQINMLQSV